MRALRAVPAKSGDVAAGEGHAASTLGDQVAATAIRAEPRHVGERAGVHALDHVSVRESGTISGGAFGRLYPA